MGSAPSELSIVSTTSARPSGGRPAVPAKMTSSIFPPRSDFAPCSPRTHAIASTTLDLPEPFGPTTQVMPGSNRSVVEDAKDLKPRSVRLFRCTAGCSVRRRGRRGRPLATLTDASPGGGYPRRVSGMKKGRRCGAPGWIGVTGSGQCRLLLDAVGYGQREHVVVDVQTVPKRRVGRLQPSYLVLELADAVTKPPHLSEDSHVRSHADMTEQCFCHRGHPPRSRVPRSRHAPTRIAVAVGFGVAVQPVCDVENERSRPWLRSGHGLEPARLRNNWSLLDKTGRNPPRGRPSLGDALDASGRVAA